MAIPVSLCPPVGELHSGASETFNVTLELVRRGYTENEIGKLWSGNLLRVCEEVEAVAGRLQSEARWRGWPWT